MTFEREAKFYLSDLSALEARLQSIGARRIKPRVHEMNLRFDTPSQDLTRTFQVLRLRQDSQVRLTYKGPGKIEAGVRNREEIEFAVGSFEAARNFLQALGYQVSFVYEKCRTRYELNDVEVVLDETPIGHFVEIEGPDGIVIRAAAAHLGLDWEARITESYLRLFQLARTSLGLAYRDMTFEHFNEMDVEPETMGVRVADDS